MTTTNRWWCVVAVLLVAVVAYVGGQTIVDTHPGKVVIASSASDALTVVGGTNIGGALNVTGAATIAGVLNAPSSAAGLWTFSGTTTTFSAGGGVVLLLKNTTALTDAKQWFLRNIGGTANSLAITACNDVISGCTDAMVFARSGATTPTVTINAALHLLGSLIPDVPIDLGSSSARIANLYMSATGGLFIPTNSNNTPASSLCDDVTDSGRMIFVEDDNALYICPANAVNGWQKATTTDAGI